MSPDEAIEKSIRIVKKNLGSKNIRDLGDLLSHTVLLKSIYPNFYEGDYIKKQKEITIKLCGRKFVDKKI